jgi:hypothetical protein
MPVWGMSKKRWAGVTVATVLIVGQSGDRLREVTIHKGTVWTVRIDFSGLPCGLYFTQIVNERHHVRSVTAVWAAFHNRAVRIQLVGASPPPVRAF